VLAGVRRERGKTQQPFRPAAAVSRHIRRQDAPDLKLRLMRRISLALPALTPKWAVSPSGAASRGLSSRVARPMCFVELDAATMVRA